MKSLIACLSAVIVLTLMAWPRDVAAAADRATPSQPSSGVQIVRGELLKIDGEFYIVKEAGGKEVRLRVNKETVVDARVKAGQKVDAQVLPNGDALTIFAALQ
jgi:hypothetical protein